MTARYIAIDWGSTNLRAWLYQGDHCLESRQSEAGVTRLNGKSPAAVLAEVTTDWREEKTPVVMAGMVGSNVGWKVAPYLSVPACFSSIGEQLTSVGDNIWIIPGLCVSHDDNHNVMRGEETQLIGARTSREQVSEFLWFVDWRRGRQYARLCGHQHAITLVAGTSLTARYQQAFQAMGCDVTAVAGDTAFQAGIRSIAHAVAN